MGQVVRSFRVGDVVRGLVQEALPDGDLIVSFQGDLLRVANRTGRGFQAGAEVALIVADAKPLKFRLHERSDKRPGKFDVRI